MEKLPSGILKLEKAKDPLASRLKVTIQGKIMKITTFLALLRYVEKMQFKYLSIHLESGELALTILKDY